MFPLWKDLDTHTHTLSLSFNIYTKNTSVENLREAQHDSISVCVQNLRTNSESVTAHLTLKDRMAS